MRRRRLWALLLAALMLSGCWDLTSIEDVAYVVSIGVDKAEEEFLWTFRVVEAESLPVGMMTVAPNPTGENELSSGLMTARARTLEQAVQVLQPSFARILSLEHVRFVILGEEVARERLGLLLSQFLRHHEIRRAAGMAVARGRAVDVFRENQPVGERNPAKFLEGVLLAQKRFHLSPPMRVQHFYNRVAAPGLDAVLPLISVNEGARGEPGSPLPAMGSRSLKAGEFPRNGGNPTEVAGMAVFHKDRLMGMLDVNESIAILALRGEMGKVYQTVPDLEGRPITIRYGQETKPQYRVSLDGENAAVQIRLVIDGELICVAGMTDYTEPTMRRQLEEHIAAFADATVYNPLVRKLYNEWGADPIGLGQVVRRRFPTFLHWMEYGWSDRIQEVVVTVQTEFFVRRFGLLIEQPEELGGC
ncbi:MAG: Ger(x)C family spore germination protein [Bacillota bacterium]